MGILSGLDGFGLSGLENVDIFGAEKKPEQKEAAPETLPELTEADLVFQKGFNCPCCDKEFKARTVKIGKAKLIGTDIDLRPKYEIVDSLKYDVIMCPHCGYTALSRFFQYITGPQIKLIKTNISATFRNNEPKGDIYSYDEAVERYKMALANAIVKRGKSSERAYICLKMAWVIRGKCESLDKSAADYAQLKQECDNDENELLQTALDGFLAARQSESFPLCGMDETTVDYLIAVLSMRFGQYEVAAKLVSAIITSAVANKRMKEKARNLKELLVAEIKGNQKR